jgi:elongation factor G
MLAPSLRFLDQHSIPHILFVNKVEGAKARLAETLTAIQEVSDRKLLLREAPLRDSSGIVGFVDLISERAYRYRPGQKSERIPTPDPARPASAEARQTLLENLADLDDHLLEELLSDIVPDSAEVYRLLARDLASDLVVPVFFGSGAQDFGVRRLLKALRHDVASRPGDGARIFKTVHAAHTGKLSFARIWSGAVAESALYKPEGKELSKTDKAGPGEVVALGRIEALKTGDLIGTEKNSDDWPAALPALFCLAIEIRRKQDEVKLTGALTKLCEEDPSLRFEHDPDTGELVLWGQGEIHLNTALERLRSRFNLDVTGHRAQVPYRETIRKSVSEHGRHKRQTGGHGQFGDVFVDIAPLPRGGGFVFADKVVGGVVPKHYIPAVEEGAREAMKRGPLGFPVVDVKLVLTSGSYHSVDSSDMAFKQAGRLAMSEGLAKADPVLLEPVLGVEIAVPADYTSKAQLILSSRRGRILGTDAKEGWRGWDTVSAHLPQSEMAGLIVDLRSLTMGVGTFSWSFAHFQELQGKAAEKIIAAQ